MRIPLLALLALFPLGIHAEEAPAPTNVLGVGDHPLGELKDPRGLLSLYETIRDGESVRPVREIGRSILIICWMPDPNGKFETYQISGIEGYHSRENAEAFMEEFYQLDQPEVLGKDPLNVVIAGNNWGAGFQLNTKLKALSKEHKFSVFYAGGWAFRKAVLNEEPEPRLRMIRAAFEKTKSEQDGTGQPATRPESKSEGGEKPQPEAEGRSR